MANIFKNLPMPAGNGPGAAVDVSAMGGEKSIVVGGSFPGAVISVEASTDGGNVFQPIWAFSGAGKKVVSVAAQFLRVNVSGRSSSASFSANVDVGANDNGALFLDLPMPIGDGTGTPVDVSALGLFTTFTVGGLMQGTTVSIEVSEDGISYFPCGMSFADQGGIRNRNVVASFMRTLVSGRKGNSYPFTATVSIGATNDTGGADADELVKVSPVDTTAGYLDDKLVEGSGVALTVLNPGGDESLEVSVSGADAGNIDTGPPITVRGPINAEGTSLQIARADHDHRLEYEVEDEGVLVSARPRINFRGDGVAAVDIPGFDKTEVTIPGAPLGDGGAVVKRSVYEDSDAATSGVVFVDGMSGSFVTVPLPGAYWVMWEGECDNQAAISGLEVAISVNSTTVPVPTSERVSQGPAANFRPFVTTVQIPGLNAGDLIRGLFRRVGPTGSVSLHNRHLTIIKVQ